MQGGEKLRTEKSGEKSTAGDVPLAFSDTHSSAQIVKMECW
jgi:hypothetical protein